MTDTLAIIPTFLREPVDLHITKKCIETLLDTAPPEVDVLVVDDGSPDEDLVEKLDSFCRASDAYLEVLDANGGFARAVNVGLRRARRAGQNALLVNADIEFVEEGWFDALIDDPADVVGGLLVFPNGLVQHAGVFYSVVTRTWDHCFRMSPRTLDLVQHRRICPVTGALQLIKAETLKSVGIYDSKFQMGFEDVDYCIEVFRSGRICAYTPAAMAVHYEGLFRRRDDSGEITQKWENSLAYLAQKHEGYDFFDFVPTMMLPEDYGS